MFYEYKIMRSVNMKPLNEEQLNELGKDGWMLIQILPINGEILVYMMRISGVQQ